MDHMKQMLWELVRVNLTMTFWFSTTLTEKKKIYIHPKKIEESTNRMVKTIRYNILFSTIYTFRISDKYEPTINFGIALHSKSQYWTCQSIRNLFKHID